MVVSRKEINRSVCKNNNYECRIQTCSEDEHTVPLVVKRKSNLFDRYSSESQQKVERRKRTTSRESRSRPVTLSAVQDLCLLDIKNQLTDLTKKMNKLVDVTDARLNVIENKLHIGDAL